MDNNNQPPVTPPPAANTPPVIPESDMKLPEEQFTVPAAPAESSKKFGLGTVLLLLLMVVLLGALTAVVIWGEELVNMIMPVETVTTDPMNEMATTAVPTEEQELNNIESDLDNVDFAEMESELNAIEAEINSEASSTATTTAQ